jgi:hypothetical protein
MPDLGFLKHDVLTWVIIGAQTGPGAKQNQPKREWIQSIVDECRKEGVPLFMKDSLLEIWEDPLISNTRRAAAEGSHYPHCDRNASTYDNTARKERRDTTACKIGTAIHLRHIPGRYARTSPPWCPKRGGGDQSQN